VSQLDPRAARALTILIGIGAAIGLAFGLFGAMAVSATGLSSVHLPPLSMPAARPSPSTAGPTPNASQTPTATPSSQAPQPQLTTANAQVSAGVRFDLTGQLPTVASGTLLQVQQRTDGTDWADFPVTTTAKDGGAFTTTLYTATPGVRYFRVIDKTSGSATPELKMQIS
jgi:hypothetical protein